MLNTRQSTTQRQDSMGQNCNTNLLKASFVIAKWHR